jgi:hypothetical protein
MKVVDDEGAAAPPLEPSWLTKHISSPLIYKLVFSLPRQTLVTRSLRVRSRHDFRYLVDFHYHVLSHRDSHFFCIRELFLALLMILYQFDTVLIEYTTVIPSDDLRFFNPLRGSLNSSVRLILLSSRICLRFAIPI